MKKIISIILCVSMLFAFCSCGTKNQETQKSGTSLQSNELLSNLQSLKTKEDLARLLNIKPENAEQMLAYIKNYYNNLPSEDEAADLTNFGTTDKGDNCLTIDQARALVTPIVLTPDNWKEYMQTSVETGTYTYPDENGNEIEETYTEARVDFKEGYYPLWSDFHLILFNKATEYSYDYDSWFWPEAMSYEDGKTYVDFYSDERGEIKTEFNLDNYICYFADAVIYKIDVDKKFCYIQGWDDDTFDQVFTPIDGVEDEVTQTEAVVLVLNSDDNSDYCCVGYSGLGSYVYCDEEVKASLSKDKEVKTKKVNELTFDVLSACKTKEEVAALVGVSNLQDMNQYLAYLKNFYNHLPSENDKKEPVTSWSTSDEGYNSLTADDAKTLVTPYIITTENWKEFIVPYMEDVDSYSYDKDGNETFEVIQEPRIGISKEYNCFRDDVRLSFVNNNTGNEFVFDGDWPESVDLKDGKYYVTSFDDNGFGKQVEFNIDDYTCTLADGVVYKFDLSHELLYIEYFDEAIEDWVVENIDDTKQEYEENDVIVFIQYGKTNSDICRVGYRGLGNYIYVDCRFEKWLAL